MRGVILLIGVLVVAGAAIAWFLGIGSLISAPENGDPAQNIEQPDSTGEEERPAQTSSGNPLTEDIRAPERFDMPAEDTAELPETMPRVDPDGETRRITMDILPGPPSSDLETCQSDPEPILRIAPRYPTRMGPTEGNVTVEFTISKSGSVENPRIVASSDPKFERAALRAVEQWKYSPCLIDGEPAEVTGVQVTVEFRVIDDREN